MRSAAILLVLAIGWDGAVLLLGPGCRLTVDPAGGRRIVCDPGATARIVPKGGHGGNQ